MFGTQYFDIDPSSGDIIIKAPIDREKKEVYNIVVMVSLNTQFLFISTVILLSNPKITRFLMLSEATTPRSLTRLSL